MPRPPTHMWAPVETARTRTQSSHAPAHSPSVRPPHHHWARCYSKLLVDLWLTHVGLQVVLCDEQGGNPVQPSPGAGCQVQHGLLRATAAPRPSIPPSSTRLAGGAGEGSPCCSPARSSRRPPIGRSGVWVGVAVVVRGVGGVPALLALDHWAMRAHGELDRVVPFI